MWNNKTQEKGNEKADENVKKATNSSDVQKINITTYADLKNQIKERNERMLFKWQTQIRNLQLAKFSPE